MERKKTARTSKTLLMPAYIPSCVLGTLRTHTVKQDLKALRVNVLCRYQASAGVLKTAEPDGKLWCLGRGEELCRMVRSRGWGAFRGSGLGQTVSQSRLRCLHPCGASNSGEASKEQKKTQKKTTIAVPTSNHSGGGTEMPNPLPIAFPWGVRPSLKKARTETGFGNGRVMRGPAVGEGLCGSGQLSVRE